MLGTYWGASGSAFASRFRALVAWAPVEGEVIAVGAALGALVLLVVAVQLVAMAVRPDGADRDPPGRRSAGAVAPAGAP
jgi:hypothetical protein